MKTLSNSGISIFSIAFILLLILKICNVISWSWWIVICVPLLLPGVLYLIIIFATLALAMYENSKF